MVLNCLAPSQAVIVDAAQRGHGEAQTLRAEKRRSVNHLIIHLQAGQQINCLFFSNCFAGNIWFGGNMSCFEMLCIVFPFSTMFVSDSENAIRSIQYQRLHARPGATTMPFPFGARV